MEKLQTNLEKVFLIFCEKEDLLRPALLKPFEINERVYATDAVSIIRTDKQNIDFEFENKEKTPDAEYVYSKNDFSLSEELIIDERILDELKIEDVYTEGEEIDCPICDGNGEVEWEFDRWTQEWDCPSCNGSGYSESKERVKTGEKGFGYGKYHVKLKEVYFRLEHFYKLIETKNILNEKIFYKGCHKQNTPSGSFKIGNCEIIIMGTIHNDLDKPEHFIDLNQFQA